MHTDTTLKPKLMSVQEGVDTTNSESLMAAASSNSNTQYADAARSILVAIAANRSADVSAAVGSVVLTAYAQNNTQVAILRMHALCTPASTVHNSFSTTQHQTEWKLPQTGGSDF